MYFCLGLMSMCGWLLSPALSTSGLCNQSGTQDQAGDEPPFRELKEQLRVLSGDDLEARETGQQELWLGGEKSLRFLEQAKGTLDPEALAFLGQLRLLHGIQALPKTVRFTEDLPRTSMTEALKTFSRLTGLTCVPPSAADPEVGPVEMRNKSTWAVLESICESAGWSVDYASADGPLQLLPKGTNVAWVKAISSEGVLTLRVGRTFRKNEVPWVGCALSLTLGERASVVNAKLILERRIPNNAEWNPLLMIDRQAGHPTRIQLGWLEFPMTVDQGELAEVHGEVVVERPFKILRVGSGRLPTFRGDEDHSVESQWDPAKGRHHVRIERHQAGLEPLFLSAFGSAGKWSHDLGPYLAPERGCVDAQNGLKERPEELVLWSVLAVRPQRIKFSIRLSGIKALVGGK